MSTVPSATPTVASSHGSPGSSPSLSHKPLPGTAVAAPPSPTSPSTTASPGKTGRIGRHGASAKAAGPPAGVSQQAPLELSKWRFMAIFISLMFSIFLFALDQLIVATAIPKITDEFHALDQISWMTSGFFLTLLGFCLMYSQWNQIFPSKHVIMFAIFIFEIGSLVCGVAPSVVVLILGRAIAGLGAAGIFSGGMIIIAELTSLHERAKYFGLFGVCFAIASILGPLLGGAFSQHLTWRWCFYINLPFGGVALAMIFFFQPASPPLGRAASYKGYNMGMVRAVARCDWLGVAISMALGCVTILGMEWGGITKPWNNGSVIACFVMIPGLLVIFVGWEWWLGDERAMFKMGLIRRRNVIGAAGVLFNLFAVFMLEVYYISEAFQAVYHASATSAGVRLLPFILGQVATLIAMSRIIPKIGRFKWIIVAGPCFAALGSGLMYSVNHTTSVAHIYGYSTLIGFGIGMTMQNTMLAVQFDLKKEPWLMAAGTGTITFVGFFGRIIGISLAGSVFENQILVNLRKYAPGLSIEATEAVLNSATAVWTSVPEDMREPVLIAYTKTLSQVYIIGVPFSILSVLFALLIKNSKMQSKEEEMASNAALKEKAAMAKAEAEKGIISPEEAEKVGQQAEADAVQDEREANIALGTAMVAPEPPQVVEGGVDAQAVLAHHEGKSAV